MQCTALLCSAAFSSFTPRLPSVVTPCLIVSFSVPLSVVDSLEDITHSVSRPAHSVACADANHVLLLRTRHSPLLIVVVVARDMCTAVCGSCVMLLYYIVSVLHVGVRGAS